jgi:hypothetical protein
MDDSFDGWLSGISTRGRRNEELVAVFKGRGVEAAGPWEKELGRGLSIVGE